MSLAPQVCRIIATRWRFIYTLGCLFACTLALTPRAEASFIGYYAIGNWMQINSAVDGTGSAMTPDSGMTVVVTGSQSGSGNPSSFDFVIVAPSSGTVMFDYTYTSLDTTPPLCGPMFTDPCDDGGYLINGVYTKLATGLSQTTTPTLVSFSVNAGDTFGFRVNAVDNTGEPGNLTLSNFSAPLAVPEPGTAGLFALAAAASIGLRRRIQRRI